MTTKVPKFGDAEMQSRDIVEEPSRERMPFDRGGALKSQIGPLREKDFMKSPDLAGFPQWKRTRGNEWTQAPFRKVVLLWLRDFFRAHRWARTWKVEERATSAMSVLRLPDAELYLVITVADGAGRFAAASINFLGQQDDFAFVRERLVLVEQMLVGRYDGGL